MRRHRRLIAVVGLIVGAALAPRAGTVRVAADVPSYTIEDLGVVPPGGEVPTITGMNDAGQVSGYTSSQAVRYTNNVGFEVLAGFENTTSAGWGINVHGDVVGYSPTDVGMRAFRHVNGTPQFIQPLDGDPYTVGLGINESGVVVGYTFVSGVGPRAFRAIPGATLEVLTTLDNGLTVAKGINDSGQITGYSLVQSVQHAFRLDADGSMHDLGSFGLTTMSVPNAIDASGDVVGFSSYDPDANGVQVTHAFRYTAGQMQDIHTVSAPFSNAYGVSGKWTVGYFQFDDGSQRAFVHTHADGMVDLNTRIDPNSGWVLLIANAVNTSGQIVGVGSRNDEIHVFRLTRADKTPPVINSVTASPSSLVPPNNLMVAVSVSVDATDDSGEAPACSITSITGGTDNDHSVNPPLGALLRAVAGTTYTLVVECQDAAGNKASAATAVDVPPDTTPPVFTSLVAKPSSIAPPNGARVTVTTEATATDDSGQPPFCKLGSITGPGTAGVDFDVTGANTGFVLAVGGRTYVFNELCVDGSNNVAWKSVNVVVPPDTTPPVITDLSASPSTIAVQNGQMIPVGILVTATDDSGAIPVCAVTGVTSPGPAGDGVVTGPLAVSVRAVGGRTYTVQVGCKDPNGNTANAAVAVVVQPDTTAPVISSVSVTPSTIWPANHQFVGVGVDVSATDNTGVAPDCSVTAVTANDGSIGDAVITGPMSISVKAEKDRVYAVQVSCGDAAGNVSVSSACVFVAKDHGNGAIKPAALKFLLARREFGQSHKK